MKPLWHLLYDNVPIFSTPVLLEQIAAEAALVVVVPFVNGEMVCWRIESTELEEETMPIISSNEEKDEKGLVSAPIVSLLNHTMLWQQQFSLGSFFSSMTLISQKALEGGEASRVIGCIGCHDGILRVIDLISGKLLCQYDVQSVIFATPALLTVSRDLHYLIVATTAGEMVMLRLDGCFLGASSEKEEKEGVVLSASCRLRLNGEIFSSPVLWENRIYLGCRDDHLYCLYSMIKQ